MILGLSPLLRAWSRGGDLKGVILPGREAMGRGQRRRLLLFAFFFSALLLLSALNMVAERPQVHRLLDKLLLGLLLLLAGVLFLLPRGAGPFARGVWRNSLRLGLTLLWLPRLLGASLRHDLWGRKGKGGVSRRLLLREWEGWWRRWPLGEAPDLDRPSRYSLLSLHRMVMDLPLVGLALMILVIGLLLLLVRWGDDPLTPVWDGWLIRWLQELARSSLSLGVTGWPLLLVLIGLTVLATEVLNNSTVMLSLLGLLAAVPEKVLGEVPLLFWFLAVTLASTAAFMGPLASPVNAVVVGGLPGVRLRRMMLWGLVANGICAVWLWGCMGLLVWL